jgi:hypothetical protein
MLLNCHELIGFMSPELSQEIVEHVFLNDKPVYRAVLAAVAEAHRVRPVFLERKPRKQRHADMIAVLSRPRLEEAAASLLRGWLLKSEQKMIAQFLEALDIPHKDGVVDDFPEEIEADKLNAAIDALLEAFPPERVLIYLNTVRATGGVQWASLGQRLQEDERLQLA